MNSILWQSPKPSSGFLKGTSVQLRPKREIAITFEFEGEDEEVYSGELIFSEVVHYRTTFLAALSAEVIQEAYDRVVDVGNSRELQEIVFAIHANGRQADVRHYRVCFDDGPAFDFVASSFSATIA